jgi:hypothetical protein
MQMLHQPSLSSEPRYVAGYGSASRGAVILGVGLLALLAMLLVWVLSAVTG